MSLQSVVPTDLLNRQNGLTRVQAEVLAEKINRTSSTAAAKSCHVTYSIIPITKIHLGRFRLRRVQPSPKDPHVKSLAESIKEQGLLQPIVVVSVEDYFELVAGEHRLTACIFLGWTDIPAIVRTDVASALLVAFAENAERKQFDPFEEALALRTILAQTDMTQEDLAKKIGHNQSYIAHKLQLVRIPEFIVDIPEMSEGRMHALLPMVDYINENIPDKILNSDARAKLEQYANIPTVKNTREAVSQWIQKESFPRIQKESFPINTSTNDFPKTMTTPPWTPPTEETEAKTPEERDKADVKRLKDLLKREPEPPLNEKNLSTLQEVQALLEKAKSLLLTVDSVEHFSEYEGLSRIHKYAAEMQELDKQITKKTKNINAHLAELSYRQAYANEGTPTQRSYARSTEHANAEGKQFYTVNFYGECSSGADEKEVMRIFKTLLAQDGWLCTGGNYFRKVSNAVHDECDQDEPPSPDSSVPNAEFPAKSPCDRKRCNRPAVGIYLVSEKRLYLCDEHNKNRTFIRELPQPIPNGVSSTTEQPSPAPEDLRTARCGFKPNAEWEQKDGSHCKRCELSLSHIKAEYVLKHFRWYSEGGYSSTLHAIYVVSESPSWMDTIL